MVIVKKRVYLIAGIALFIGISPAYAWRDTYDDCIINNISKATIQSALVTLKKSCTSKHFDTAPDSEKRSLVSSSLESYKQTDPKFYEWVIKARELNAGVRNYELVDHWVNEYGFPKR